MAKASKIRKAPLKNISSHCKVVQHQWSHNHSLYIGELYHKSFVSFTKNSGLNCNKFWKSWTRWVFRNLLPHLSLSFSNTFPDHRLYYLVEVVFFSDRNSSWILQTFATGLKKIASGKCSLFTCSKEFRSKKQMAWTFNILIHEH